MSTITKPVMLDETGQSILTKLQGITDALTPTVATTAKMGSVKPDGSTILVDADGLIHILGNNDSGFHNALYRGKNLGTSVTAAQYASIAAGTFDDMYIGDYWVIGNVNWRIADFNYWLRTGDTECTTYHIVIVPDTCLYNAQMNTTDITTGAYVGSAMYKSNLANARTTINNTFGSSHILNHREYFANAVTNGYESGGAWYGSTVDLMTEQMVYGDKIFHNSIQGTNWAYSYTVGKSQLSLFRYRPDLITNRVNWWLRDVAASASFAHVHGPGLADANNASHSFGVRPAFAIKAA